MCNCSRERESGGGGDVFFKSEVTKEVYEAYEACDTMKTNPLLYIREEQLNLELQLNGQVRVQQDYQPPDIC